MTKTMEGKVGLVFGAGSGSGRTSALAFAAEGGKVVVSDSEKVQGEETVRLIREAGGEAYFYQCNILDKEQVKKLIDFTVTKFGRIDWAHNNIIGLDERQPVSGETLVKWDQVIKINLFGYYNLLKQEIQAMHDTGGGTIVNTSAVYVAPEQAQNKSKANFTMNGDAI